MLGIMRLGVLPFGHDMLLSIMQVGAKQMWTCSKKSGTDVVTMRVPNKASIFDGETMAWPWQKMYMLTVASRVSQVLEFCWL